MKSKEEQMDMETSNKLIAEFMGYDDVNCNICKYNYDCNHLQCGLSNLEQDTLLIYHSSWDWLMPVVEKINSLNYEVILYNDSCKIMYKNYTIEEHDTMYKIHNGTVCDLLRSTHESIIEFINLYNKKLI